MFLAKWFRTSSSDGRRGREDLPPSVPCDPVCENPCRFPSKRYWTADSSFSLYNCDSSSPALSEKEQMTKLRAYLIKQYEKVDGRFHAYLPDADPPVDPYEFYQTFLKEMIEEETYSEGFSAFEMSWSYFLCWWVMTPENLHPAILDFVRTERITVSDEPTQFHLRTVPLLLGWFQAEEGSYNIHVHASAKNDREILRAISYAYLIRDCKGDVRYNNFGAFDCSDDGHDYALFGAMLAIKDSLQACLSMEILCVKIYTDCVDAYKIFQGEDFPADLRVYVEKNRQAHLGEVVRAVKEMMDRMTSCDVLLCEESLNETARLLSSYAYRIVRGRLPEEKKLEMMQAVGDRVAMEKEKKGCFQFLLLG